MDSNAALKNLPSDFDPVAAKSRALAAWDSYKQSVVPTRHRQIIEALANSPAVGLTPNEIFQAAEKYGFPKPKSNGHGSRISELRDMGVIAVYGERVCSVTGSVVPTYVLTGDAPREREVQSRAPVFMHTFVTPEGMTTNCANHQLPVEPGMVELVWKLDRRRSAKDKDGVSLVPAKIIDFSVEVASAAPGRRKRQRHETDGGQSDLFPTVAEAEAPKAEFPPPPAATPKTGESE